jgi:serine phosphatase RsbU (regulator of sigma subunit)
MQQSLAESRGTLGPHLREARTAGTYLLQLATVALAYFAAGRLGLAVPFTSGNVSPVWPPAGIALAAVLLLGNEIAPGIALGAFFVNFLSGIPLLASAGIGVGSTLGPLTGAALLREVPVFHPSLIRLRDVLALFVFGAVCGTAVSASIGVVALTVAGVHAWAGFGPAWLIWWLGDGMGILLVTPLILTGGRMVREDSKGQWAEFLILLAATVCFCLFLFDNRVGFGIAEDTFALAVFPFVIWAAVRFGVGGAAFSTAVVSAVTIWETATGYGPFVRHLSPLHNAAVLQSFLAVISVSGLSLAAAIVERQGAERALQRHTEDALATASHSLHLAQQTASIAEREMEIARQVQIRLFPQKMPRLRTLEYVGQCLQARAVGGDYYDFLDMGSGRVGFVMADIAGKGLSAALLMANLQANLRGQYVVALEDLPALLKSVNRLLYDHTEPSHYATLFFGSYEDHSRQLRYVNCGHNPPLLLRADTTVERLTATTTVLGLFDDWECSIAEERLVPGDLLVVYTDGLTEAMNDRGEEFGEARLLAALCANRHLDVSCLLSTLVGAVQQFSPGEQGDDLTLVIARGR